MKLVDLKLSRFVPGPPEEVFDVWFDPASPGGPWHGAKKAIMNFTVDGMFYFGIERAVLEQKGVVVHSPGLHGHFGRFAAIDRPRAVEHTWMSEHTHGIETTVSVTFEPRDGGTQLTILHRSVPDDESGRRHEGGWASLLARVERFFRGEH
ncbi:MAG: SRPBCC domain-containing protein [Myxococcota bacterium]|nr:SRPBCC domain-containing protein [Myxococcota bacterium]